MAGTVLIHLNSRLAHFLFNLELTLQMNLNSYNDASFLISSWCSTKSTQKCQFSRRKKPSG